MAPGNGVRVASRQVRPPSLERATLSANESGAAMSPPPMIPLRVSRNCTLAPPEVALPWPITVS
jgi:hypothetical protein